MSPLFAIVLAQAITLGVHDRTEARHVVVYDHHYEAETVPSATLALVWPHYDLNLSYAVSLLEMPLESSSRQLLAYHTLALSTGYHVRHTSLVLNNRTSFGELNFLVAALANPVAQPPMGDTTANGQNGDANGNGNTSGQPQQPANGSTQPKPPTIPVQGVLQTRTFNRPVRYETSTTNLQATHVASPELTLGAFAAYTIAGGTSSASRVDYPTTRGTIVGAQANHVWRLTGREAFVSDAFGQQAFSSNGNLATSLLATESWRHTFDARTGSIVGAGLSVLRFASPNGLVAYSIFPTFQLGAARTSKVARGNLSLQLTMYSNPALDPLRATVDPRLGGAASVAWTGKRFFSSLAGNGAISLAPQGNDAGAFDALRGTFVVGYLLTDWLSVDSGVRVAQQRYQHTTLVPISYAIFGAFNVDYDWPLSGRRPKQKPAL